MRDFAGINNRTLCKCFGEYHDKQYLFSFEMKNGHKNLQFYYGYAIIIHYYPNIPEDLFYDCAYA